MDLNPLHLIKQGADAVEKKASEAVHAGVNLLSIAEKSGSDTKGIASSASSESNRLLSSALELGKTVLHSVTNIDLKDLEKGFSAVGSTLSTTGLAAVAGPVGLLGAAAMALDAKTVAKSASFVSDLSNHPEVAAKLGFKTGKDGVSVSADGTVQYKRDDSIKTVKDSHDASDLAAYLDKAHQQFSWRTSISSRISDHFQQKVSGNESAELDMSQDIYAGNDAAEQNAQEVQTHHYSRRDGSQVDVQVRRGEFSYRATKNGEVETEAMQANGVSTLYNKGEFASLKNGELQFTNAEISAIQKGGDGLYHVHGGMTVRRHEGELDVLDRAGKVIQHLSANGLQLSGGVRVVHAEGNGALQQKAEQAQEQNTTTSDTANKLSLAIAHDNSFYGIWANGARIVGDAHNDAVLKTTDGLVLYIPKHGRVRVFVDGQFVSIRDAARMGKAKTDEHGNLIADGMKVSETGNIQFGQNSLNVGADGKPVIKTQDQTVTANGNQVNSVTHDGDNVTTDLQQIQVRAKEMIVDLHNVHINKSGTDISPDNTVQMGGQSGPRLNGDGSMKLDEQTTIDSRGNVNSGSWHASTGGDSRSESIMQVRSTFQAQVNNTSSLIAAEAMAIYAKALSGKVTMSDINALNDNLATVTGLMHTLSASGCTQLVPALNQAQSVITETIGFALPRAKAA